MKRMLSVLLMLALSAPLAHAKPKKVEVWTGETVTVPITRTKVVAKTMLAHSESPKIASAKWGGGENGPVIISGLSKGETIVKVYGEADLVSVGIKTREDNKPLTSQQVAGEIAVTVYEPEQDKRVIMLDKGQKMSIHLPRKAKIREIKEGNRAIASVRKTMLNRIEVHGREPGSTAATVKYYVPAQGKDPEQRVEGTLTIHVSDKRAKEKRLKENWTSLGTALGVVILDDEGNPVPPVADDEDASFDDGSSEPISFRAPCLDYDGQITAGLGFNGVIGDDIVDTGLSFDFAYRVPLRTVLGDSTPALGGLNPYLTAGFGYQTYDSSDNYIDDITGWSVNAGIGVDAWFGDFYTTAACCFGLRDPLPVCWGWAAETTLSFTRLTAEGDYFDESANSLAVNVKTGPRFQIRDSGWSGEINVGGSLLLTDYDFGVNNADSGRLSYRLDAAIGYGF